MNKPENKSLKICKSLRITDYTRRSNEIVQMLQGLNISFSYYVTFAVSHIHKLEEKNQNKPEIHCKPCVMLELYNYILDGLFRPTCFYCGSVRLI